MLSPSLRQDIELPAVERIPSGKKTMSPFWREQWQVFRRAWGWWLFCALLLVVLAADAFNMLPPLE
ncbi:unnamed protein product [marine sediment metagenome]|uniref:Uncharacterized protein n=1 Tax=marine sediment metagenome TaxID=412755 RepID=X0RXE7_9ZZZZ